MGASLTTLLEGELTLAQPPGADRVTSDTLWLARFASLRVARHVVDLGAGVGGAALAYAVLAPQPPERVTLVELDPELTRLAARNARAVSKSLGADPQRWSAVCRDLRTGPPPALQGGASLVLCNPPYRTERTSTPAAASSKRRAHNGPLEPFLGAARGCLGARGRAAFCFPAHDLLRLLDAARARGLHPKRLRMVHATSRHPARLALVELVPGRPGGLVVEPPQVERPEVLSARRAAGPA